LIRLSLESESITLKLGLHCLMEDLLRLGCEKFSVSFDEYTLEFPDGSFVELDKNLKTFQLGGGISDLNLKKSEKKYNMMSIFEDGQEVVIMQIASSG
jgi:hypothetical protein